MATPSPAVYRTLVNGTEKNVQAAVVGGADDANKIPGLDGNGNLTMAMMPPELVPNVDAFVASEDLAAGAFVTFVTDPATGTTTMKNAVASAWATQAMGHVKQAVAKNASGTVFSLPDKNTSVALDKTKLGHQYLSATVPGAVTNVPPTGAGNISQYLGYATSVGVIHTVCYPPVILA